jgi:hypothetical protein
MPTAGKTFHAETKDPAGSPGLSPILENLALVMMTVMMAMMVGFSTRRDNRDSQGDDSNSSKK